jgi:hypothetical protein
VGLLELVKMTLKNSINKIQWSWVLGETEQSYIADDGKLVQFQEHEIIQAFW